MKRRACRQLSYLQIRWPHTIYLKDARPSPRPRHHCQRRASMSPTSRWLEKKQLFVKHSLLGGSMQGLCPACCALPAAADGRAFPKVAVCGESSAETRHAPPISFHGTEAREQLTWPDLCQRGKQPAGRALPFLGSGFFAKALSAAASLSFHRLICSCLILKKRICFCSSLSSASRSGSMYISDNICFSMAAGFSYTRLWQ